MVDSAIALTAITAFLYCASTAQYDGFLSIFRLDADILDRNFHQTLYNGFIVSMVPAYLALLFFTLAHFVYSHLLICSIRDFLRHSRKARKLLVKIGLFWRDKQKPSEFENSQKARTTLVAFYLGIFTAAIISLVYFESEGKKAANSILAKMEANDLPASSLITVRINDKPLQLLYLVCGARNCAGIEPRSKIIYYFPQNGHSYSLDAHSNNTNVPPQPTNTKDKAESKHH